MKNTTFLLFVFLFSAFAVSAQSSESCAVRLGNNYFKDCKRFIVYRGDDVVKQSQDRSRVDGFSMQLYSTSGQPIATITDGKLVSGNEKDISVVASETEFSVIDAKTGHIYCLIKKTYNNEKSWCQFDVWMDITLADGTKFLCTPESSNVSMLQYMNGGVFVGAGTAILLE
ncbi:MAG: hypothetical protein GC205_12000 [Bacteroidetes bacterium]|nr:hypothetical protein [Bacteroidota bacterium]